MKNFLLLGILGLAVSCSNVQHPDFAANVESAKTLLELQGSEADLQAQLDDQAELELSESDFQILRKPLFQLNCLRK